MFGYGNPFRQDDGVGHHLAPLLAGDLEKAGKRTRLWLGHQLLPEAALGIEPDDILLFVDASLEEYDHGFALERVRPDGRSNKGLNIHSFGPQWFLALLGDLGTGFGDAWALSITGGSFDFGEGLSDECRRRSELARKAFREKFC
ncbi:MAG TPA: hydrogenase maturation protease [Synergistales bacterium]|nr:hydrogenase maturation protease [Synergistaceae bacterium]HCR38940.1 hydrogenase maturation protease [Synergistaceae bacterium]HPA58806.1 hydrogenase maturation protease [Synergistales bacterium]HQO83280.1 hydrogenase maturation protease [Synergistales bacterium]HQQ10665.1 hydrogenase maturation protease [Synergistales bacterium]